MVIVILTLSTVKLVIRKLADTSYWIENIGDKMTENITLLLKILLNKQGREDERDEAAAYLGKYDDEEVLQALVSIGKDPSENDIVLDSCGVSIAEILIRRNKFDSNILKFLADTAKDSAIQYILGIKPDWASRMEQVQ